MARESGYLVKITGFLPVDKSDLASQKKAIDALTDALDKNDAAGLAAALTHIEIRQAFVTKSFDDVDADATAQDVAVPTPALAGGGGRGRKSAPTSEAA